MRLDSHKTGIDDVAVRSEEAWVAGLELDDLVPWRAQHRQIRRRDDPVARDGIDERAVGHIDRDPVTAAHPVDVRERREVRRPVARDVDEPVLPRHEGPQVASRPFLQGVVVGAVHEHHVQTHPWNV